ncbi:hypothetical protein HO133_010171 [Letharia lupina]|uniref:Uncharacterized protein n=1 Tax=Letharia lupina TaxID=560253 RepID=A0A8H6FED4_9LECA|nr:uncharacterized protein HO133_010171 [Letharia lupina]KAF6224976.1 hypothetical protein HO133_010171 [Letharia lupina]
MPASANTTTWVPENYKTPSFPSLYWLVGPDNLVQPRFLYHVHDIWRFTLFWTTIIFEAVHLLVGTYAVVIVWWGGRNKLKEDGKENGGGKEVKRGREESLKNIKVLWVVPVVYGIVAGVEALLAGSVVGLILGAVYNAGGFRMSTWIPRTMTKADDLPECERTPKLRTSTWHAQATTAFLSRNISQQTHEQEHCKAEVNRNGLALGIQLKR